MKKILLISALLSGVLLTACAVVPAGRGYGPDEVVVVPFLPSVVVLGVDPFYFYSGFHYHYVSDRWYYSKSRNGPWHDLPRDRYPKEVRFNDRHRDTDRHRDNDRHRDEDRGRDRD